MAKVPAPIAQTARLIDLVPFLLSHQGISLKKLAAEFHVTEKEMLNDLNTLWMCGLPGYTPLELIDLEFESGYVSIRNADVLSSVRALDSSEVISLLIGLSILEGALTDEAHQLTLMALRKKLIVISGDVASILPPQNSEYLSLIQEAVTKRRDISFKYHSISRDEVKERAVTPLELFSENGKIYLKGYCQTSRAIRTFLLERAKNLALIEDSAPRIPNSIADQEDMHFDVELRAFGRDREIIETFGAESYRDGLYRTVIFNKYWLARTVAGFGGDVELISPASLRDEISAMASRALQLYS